MLSNILIAIGFFGFGILTGLTLAAIAVVKEKKTGETYIVEITNDED